MTDTNQPQKKPETAGSPAVMGSDSLAEKLFAADGLDMELFDTVNMILGCDTGKCTDTGFLWGATDTTWDHYDCSVEIIRPIHSEWMSREQADQILALGFAQIFETVGDKARQITRKGIGTCSPREAGEVRRLKAEINALRNQNAEVSDPTEEGSLH
jgi:hypothetical protein